MALHINKTMHPHSVTNTQSPHSKHLCVNHTFIDSSTERRCSGLGEAKRDVEFIGEDKDRQLESLWRETRIGDVLPWEDVADEAQRLLDIHKASRNAPHEGQEDGGQENDQEVDQDETDPYNEVIFGRSRPDCLSYG